MIGSAIRELSAARHAALLCAAFVEETVQLWNVTTQQKIGEFASQFSFGARNLAMHPDGISVGIGNAARIGGSVALHKLPDGSMLWERRRLSAPTRLRFGRSGDLISCTMRHRTVELVDAHTGLTTEVIDNAVNYFEGPHGYSLIVPKTRTNYVLRSANEVPIEKLTFAILDVAFMTDGICLTESGGPVRCIDLNGAERWRFEPPMDSHVLRLHYNHNDGFVYGIVWHFEKGLFRHLVRLDPQTGESSNLANLQGSWEEAFIEHTQQVVTSSGDIFDLSTGQRVGHLAFPQKQYPDKVEELIV